MSEARDAKRLEALKGVLRKYRRTGPIQTSLGSYEQGIVLPLIEVAALLDEVEHAQEAVKLAGAAEHLAQTLETAQGQGTTLPMEVVHATQALQSEVGAWREVKIGANVQALIDGKRSDLVEGLGELLGAMGSKDKAYLARERERVQDSLSDLRNTVVAQGGQGEPFWRSVQGLLSALADGNEELATYHGEQLEAALGATTLSDEAAEIL